MESYEKKSDDADSDTEKLADEGDRVDESIKATKRDWEAKQGDSSVPGAVPDPGGDVERPQEAQSERGEAADSAGQ
jgi:hypothetical protein